MIIKGGGGFVVGKEYKNQFKVRLVSERDALDKIGELYGGFIEFDSKLRGDEFWYFTDTDKETLKKSVLIEILD